VSPGQQYIAAQGPMPESVVDFVNMLWDNEVKIVIMSCNEYEGIPRKVTSRLIFEPSCIVICGSSASIYCQLNFRTTYVIRWRRGSVVRTSVCSWRTFPDLCLIHG